MESHPVRACAAGRLRDSSWPNLLHHSADWDESLLLNVLSVMSSMYVDNCIKHPHAFIIQ